MSVGTKGWPGREPRPAEKMNTEFAAYDEIHAEMEKGEREMRATERATVRGWLMNRIETEKLAYEDRGVERTTKDGGKQRKRKEEGERGEGTRHITRTDTSI